MYFRNFLVLNRVKVSNPQWLTSTQILVEYPPGYKTVSWIALHCAIWLVRWWLVTDAFWTSLMAGGSFFFLSFFLSLSFSPLSLSLPPLSFFLSFLSCSFLSLFLFSVCVTYSWIKRNTLMSVFYGIRDKKKREKRDLSWEPHGKLIGTDLL